MKRRWCVVARDVDGRQIGNVMSRHWFESAARARAATERAYVPEPVKGRPLYLVSVERR